LDSKQLFFLLRKRTRVRAIKMENVLKMESINMVIRK
jgi:hypothetical protein